MTLLRLAPAVALLVLGCDGNDAPPPPPLELTGDAIGHDHIAIVAEHPGPKAQIFAGNDAEPVWFPSVRDMFAYTMLPEENQDIRAIYVSDTGASADIETIAKGAWVEARDAFYVLGSPIAGGMGLPETVPFADQGKAAAFAERHGGEVVTFDGVTIDHIFAEFDSGRHDREDKL